ncbi:hypothetical protein WH47_06969 [Habropoda laboriosa]|uniref:Uncharacterized protein n=1 Tax=Habropoda laboriosa TaxID=597456 RepID=A0A0L7RHP9_9HYME|nr:hypothetical protein WH47_06969 [Habropoda laboriosa]
MNFHGKHVSTAHKTQMNAARRSQTDTFLYGAGEQLCATETWFCRVKPGSHGAIRRPRDFAAMTLCNSSYLDFCALYR